MRLTRIYRGFALAAACLIGSSFPYPCSAQHRIELPKSLPLRFELNQGQLPAGSKFLARLQGYQVYLTPSGTEFHFPSPDSVDSSRGSSGGGSRVLHFDLVNEERSARIAGAERLPGITNYFAGKDPAQWHTGIPSYARVLYHSIYPGIDLVFYGDQKQIENDFLVSPQADTRRILFRLQGAGRPSVSASGDLSVFVGDGELLFRKPHAYQNIHGKENDVQVQYRLVSRNLVGFTVGAHDRNQPLVIDPVVLYSTYLGGSGNDVGASLNSSTAKIAADSAGNLYFSGTTSSADFPTTAGAYSTACSYIPGTGLQITSFVSKFNPSGTALIYSTFLCDASMTGLAVDNSGNAYVTGVHGATFPTTPGALQSTRGNSFIAKLNSAGDSLVYSTYFGGSGVDKTAAISADGAGNVFVTGVTLSVDFPTKNALFATLNGSGDAFISELNPAGNSLVYSTYLGGSDFDAGSDLAIDAAGDAFVIGTTNSIDFPTVNPINPSPSPSVSAFITKVTPMGAGLTYSTYFDPGFASIAADALGNAYVASAGASAPSGFVDKLDVSGTSILYSVALTGSAVDIAADAAGNAFVIGRGQGTGAHNPLQGSCNCTEENFVLQLDPLGNTIYSTPFGLPLGQFFTVPATFLSAVAADGNGNAFVGGFTTKDTILVNPFQRVFSSGAASPGGFTEVSDGFVAKIASASSPALGISAWKLDFGPQRLNVASTPINITLADQGSADLALTSVIASGDFAIGSNTCLAAVPATTTCQIGVTFTPSALGIRNGAITITDNAGGPHLVNLTGTGALPSVTLAPPSLNFPEQLVGTTSAAQVVTLSNPGALALNISQVGNSGDFLETNNCGASVNAGGSCTFSVTFTPTAAGPRTGYVTIIDDAADTPQTINLAGNGASTTATLSTNSVAFGNQVVGIISAAQPVVLTNSGSNALTISSMVISGTNASDFGLSNPCPLSPSILAAGANCSILVTFTPAAAGAESAALTITDSGVGSPRTVTVSGTGQGFTLGVASGSSGSATVTAGQTATYTLAIAPLSGFSQSVAMACSGSPMSSTCSASPNPVTVGGSSASTVTITIATIAPSLAAPKTERKINWPLGGDRLLIVLLALLTLTAVLFSQRFEKRPRLAFLILPLLLLGGCLTSNGCGGGSSSGGTTNPGTPKGTYTLTVTATFSSGSSSLTRSTTLTLVVN